MNIWSDDKKNFIRQSIDQALTLVVGKHSSGIAVGHGVGLGSDDSELQKIRLNEDVAEAFRELCRSAADRVDSAEIVEYTADAELDKGQVFVLADDSSLSELIIFREAAATAATLTPMRPADLDTKIAYYVVATGDRNRIAFVRKTNPQLDYKAGKLLASGRDKLISVEGPLFRFAPDFDFIVAPSWAIILHQHRFEQLFRETGLVAKHVAEWVKSVTDHLPMPEESITELEKAATRDSRLWRRLRAIHARGHLRQVSIDEIRKYAKSVDLEVEKVIQEEQLIFDPSERFSIMHLLNEDLFRGPLTRELFEAQRKSSV